ncbi:MAG TPA: chemotaxis response regulator protein-glutamate methylesterase [Gemmatimonadales bacterium]|jgi:two-component system chemotaxis response regulator CheB
MIRVFVVDDSPFVRKALRRVLGGKPDIRVVGEAANGDDALARIAGADVDVVTLDVEMQGLSGLEVLRQLLAGQPGLRVIMLSAHTRQGAESSLEALAAGAADFIDKQSLNFMDLDALDRELVQRVRSLGGGAPPQKASPAPVPELPGLERTELCVIGASTGGPVAIQSILERLPADFPVPIVVVQHMPPGFTRAFAARLNTLCRLQVSEAVDGVRLERGRVLIAPAGWHLRLTRSLVVALSTDPNGMRHVPSVDVLFKSAARARPGRTLGVLLTGMGDDGAEGMAVIRAGGGIAIAESESTCAVYGMPRVAVERGATSAVLPLPAIAEMLCGLQVEAKKPVVGRGGAPAPPTRGRGGAPLRPD